MSLIRSVMAGTAITLSFGQAIADMQGAQTAIEVLARSSEMWTGDPLPPYPAGTPELTVLKVTIPPKTRLPLHVHPVMNVAYVVRGSLEVETQDGQVHRLVQDDVLIEVVDVWHEGVNNGDVPAEVIVFYAGILNEPVTVFESPAEAPHPITEDGAH